MDDRIIMNEDNIHYETSKEYIDYHGEYELNNINEKEILNKSDLLFKSEITIEDKRKLLHILAHLGTIESYKVLEKYCKNPDKELKEWASLALQECRMFLESDLMDDDEGVFISGGLGGKNNKMRLYNLIFTLNDKTFTNTQKKIIKQEYKIICKNKHTDLEKIDFENNYASIMILLPFDVALAEIMDEGINKCNELGEFLFDGYYATNQDIPGKKEILEIIEKVKTGDHE